jgi:hypothetical protein
MTTPLSELESSLYLRNVGPQQGRLAGQIMRIYRASCGKTIGFDTISAIEDVRKITSTKFHHSVSRHVDSKRIWETDVSRVISTVRVIGGVNMTLSEDLNSAVFIRPENENNIEIDMSDLPQVGDSI